MCEDASKATVRRRTLDTKSMRMERASALVQLAQAVRARYRGRMTAFTLHTLRASAMTRSSSTPSHLCTCKNGSSGHGSVATPSSVTGKARMGLGRGGDTCGKLQGRLCHKSGLWH